MQNFKVKPIGKISVNEDGMFIKLEQEYIPALQALNGFSHLNVLWWLSDSDNEEMRNILIAEQPYKNLSIHSTFQFLRQTRPSTFDD